MKQKLTKLIYIASPYSGLTRFSIVNFFIRYFRYRQVTKVIGKLQDRYPYAFIAPITTSHQTAKFMKTKTGAFRDWEGIDKTYISKCDEVWVIKMEGWDTSVGVQAEIKFAKKRKIPLYSIIPEEI